MTDYFYSSARIRVMEKRVVNEEGFARILDAETDREICEILSEYGISAITDTSGSILMEQTLEAILEAAYREVEELLPNDPFVTLWRYPYDCNNIKTAIKCALLGKDPNPMLVSFGTVSRECVLDAVTSHRFDCLPEHMKNAAEEAYSALSKTRDPQTVDLILDKACYEDMLACAEKSNSDMILGWLRAKIDLINFMSSLRLLRMNSVSAEALEERVLLAGGTVPVARWINARKEGTNALQELLNAQKHCELPAKVLASDGYSLTAVETASDNAFMALIREARYLSFGGEVCAAFLLSTEASVRNLRILLSGKKAGIKKETIRERVRLGYA